MYIFILYITKIWGFGEILSCFFGVNKKDKNFCYIIVVVEKYKYDLLSLLHLKITNTYTYNFNLYKKIYIKF